MNERPLPRTGSSSGPIAGHRTEPDDEITRAERILADKTQAEKQETLSLISLEHTLDTHKQEKVKQARILTGQVSASENGEIATSSTEQEKDKAKQIQYATGAVSSVLGLLWITYAGTDAPAEVYAAVPLVVGLVGQAIATHINNRKAK